jgi:O-antigen/teichoic acid export membrane protein
MRPRDPSSFPEDEGDPDRSGLHRRDAGPRGGREPQRPEPAPMGDDGAGLSGRATRALGWSFLNTLLTRMCTFGVGILLARLLGPSQFGAYAVALVALFALQTFNELGVSLAIVRWEDDPQEIIPTVATISVLFSCVVFAACYYAAPLYTATMHASDATTPVRVIAISILVDGFVNAPSGLLQREFRQKHLMIAMQGGGWLGLGVTLWLALERHNALSLAIGQVAGTVATGTLIIAFAPRTLRLGFSPAKARELLRFGLPLALASLVSFAVTNVDQLVVGHVIGLKAIGFFVLASNMAAWPLSLISAPVGGVAPALLARLQHDPPTMRAVFLSMLAAVATVALPVCVLISVMASPLIGFIYGARWMPSAHALVWLALLSAVQVLFLPAYDFLVVLARSKLVLTVQVVWLVTLVPALVIGAHYAGIYGAALAELSVAVLVILPCYVGGLKSAAVRITALFRRLLPPAGIAVFVGAAGTLLARRVPSDFLALAAGGVLTLLAVAMPAYRMRTEFALLRSAGAETAGSAAEVAAVSEDDSITEEIAAIWGFIDAPADTRRGARKVAPNTAVDALTAAARQRPRASAVGSAQPPRTPDAALRLLLSISVPETRQTSPIYMRTVASRQWDPVQGRRAPLPTRPLPPMRPRPPAHAAKPAPRSGKSQPDRRR